MTDAPKRKVEIVIKIGADSRRDLASALFNLATAVDREEVNVGHGASGGPCSGWMYDYREDGLEHAEYFRQLDIYLESRKGAQQRSGDERG